MDISRIHYKVIGEGRPIYFFHGNTLSYVSMTETFEAVFDDIDGYERIYLDLPGMGETAADYEVDNSDKIARLLVEFIQHHSPDQDVILVGHSYGGYLALAAQHLMRDKVCKMYLTCPVVKAVASDRTLPQHRNIFLDEHKLAGVSFREFIDSTVLISRETWHLFRKVIEPGVRVYDRKYNEFLMRDNRAHYRLSFEEDLDTRGAEVMMVLGKNDGVVGYKDQLNLADANDEASTYVVAKAGHNIMIDRQSFVRSQFAEMLK